MKPNHYYRFGSVWARNQICQPWLRLILLGYLRAEPGGPPPLSLHPVASLAAMSAASLPGTPTWAGIQWMWMSLFRVWILEVMRSKTNWLHCCLGVLTAAIDAWLLVKIATGLSISGWSSTILRPSSSPITSPEYTVNSVSGPGRAYFLSRVIATSPGIGVNTVTADAPTLSSIPLPLV